MDRYVTREPRVGPNYPQGNRMTAFTTNANGNMITTETVYYDGYANEYSNVAPMRRVPSSPYSNCIPQINTSGFTTNLVPCQRQVVSGIDPRYLAGYSDQNAQYIATGITGQPIQREVTPAPINSNYGNYYQNRSFMGPEKTNIKIYNQQHVAGNYEQLRCESSKVRNIGNDDKIKMNVQSKSGHVDQINLKPQAIVKKPVESDISKNETQNLTLTRSDKLKALHKSGPRAFSGPVEKVLKWHKALQDIGVFVFYEIVAKCVSVRSGESCAKNLVIRDDNGPAMQVVYYEIDFLLPELKAPCMVRVIGRMMPGTCRLQAFSVRPATGDDVAMLPRRAAVATHHVARLCKEFSIST